MQTLKRKPRNFDGNPLAYYKKNIEVYKGMGRTALYNFDESLYRSLGKAGQLEKAIPKADQARVEIGRKLGRGELGLLNDEIEKIIEAYPVYKGNALEASRHLTYCVSTIWRKWKSSGLTACGRKLDDSEISIILKSYKKYNGNAHKASKHIPHSVSFIIRCWRSKGLEIRRAGRQKD